ncbi:MAG: purine-nucleoside phosphorylase [Adlercreutzia equolifaciens]
MALENLRGTLDEAQAVMEERLGAFRPEVGLILGSGLGPLAERIADLVFVPFGEVPGMGVSTANGHVGRFVAGTLGDRRARHAGQLHGYEAIPPRVAFPVWLWPARGWYAHHHQRCRRHQRELPRRRLHHDRPAESRASPITSTEPAAMARGSSRIGRLRPGLRWPATIRRWPFPSGRRLPEPTRPSFETPAEIQMFRSWGADAVAMSVCGRSSPRGMWGCACSASRS